ncbi:MAG: hypothetical protein JSR80_01715 [Verrucomicrobia bacterium]|nr:hypothetical protein [Verrucomicrobiota bacterium]
MDIGNSPLIGIEIYREQLRAVTLKRRGKKTSIHEGVDPGGLIISALASSDVLVRQLSLKVKNEKEIDKVRDFQLEPLLPLPIEETCICHKVVEKGESGIQLALILAPKIRVAAHLEALKSHGIDPERISCVPEALAQFIAEFAPGEEIPRGILHLGESATTLCIVKEAVVLAAHSLEMGSRDFAEESIDKTQAFKAAITKSFLALTRKKGQRISQLFATGELPSFPQLLEAASEGLEMPFVPLPDSPSSKMAVPIGLVLGALKEKKGIDFRQKELSYRHPFLRIRGRLCLFGVALFLAFISLCFLGEQVVKVKEQEVSQEYLRLLQITGEKELVPLPIDQMRARALEIQKSQVSKVDLYPLVPRIPTASDVIAALAREEGIYIQSFDYHLVRRPDPSKKNDPYRVRVELEFCSDTPTHARAFHEKLLEGHPLLDPKSEVRWVANKERYKVGFFLRNDS